MTRHIPHPTRLILALAAALPALALAAPGSDSAYRTDTQNSHVEDATSQGIAQVNMITCFMSAMKPDALVNKGNYLALLDKNKCDPNARSDSGNSGSNNAGSSAPSYMSAIVNSARATNDDPMRVKTWIDLVEKDMAATIFLNTSVSAAPTSGNPYGVFRLDYCGRGASGPCMMNGYLEGATDGISYYETSMEGGGQGQGPSTSTTALRLNAATTDTGSGR